MGRHTGKRLLTIGSTFYRVWAARSNRPGFIVCNWCQSEFLARNATGAKGHEKSETHQKNAEKFEKKQGKKKGKSAKLFRIKKDEHDEHDIQDDRDCESLGDTDSENFYDDESEVHSEEFLNNNDSMYSDQDSEGDSKDDQHHDHEIYDLSNDINNLSLERKKEEEQKKTIYMTNVSNDWQEIPSEKPYYLETKEHHSSKPNLKRKRAEYNEGDRNKKTFLTIKQYTLDKFIIKK